MHEHPWVLAPYPGGVCAVQTNGGQIEAVRLLDAAEAAALPGIDVQDSDAFSRAAVACVLREMAEPTGQVALPLALSGTPLQRRVWRALQAIPPGQTVSYTALAEQVGVANGCRAVANACGANRLAVLVPCHRVVRSDGGLGGYRWGLARKRALLAAEAKTTNGVPEPKLEHAAVVQTA